MVFNYTFDFVKGVNLVLGGKWNGEKLPFVNIIRFRFLVYKKPFGMYQGNIVEKRQLFIQKYFSNRMDDSIRIDLSPTVTIA